jgi:outer membrane protein assembly factor BamB
MTRAAVILAAIVYCFAQRSAPGDEWPRWRGPNGAAISDTVGDESPLPVRWSEQDGIAWRTEIPGEGSSSPIVSRGRVFITSSEDSGSRRKTHCLDAASGKLLWTRSIDDDDAEVTSALTGHAASTPAADGERVVAFFGNAGAVAYDYDGNQLWRRELGEFESELGLASSPIIDDGKVFLTCDHDGDRFRTFDSFLIALDVATGETIWKTDRPGLYRSWSTPIVATTAKDGSGERELVVNGQGELRGYSLATGEMLWRVGGMTDWVSPSPIFGSLGGDGKSASVFAASGRNGPTMAVRPGGRGEVTASHVVWKDESGGPYVCSPLLYRDLLYVHNEQGILTCREAKSGEVVYRQRLPGKYTASAVAGDGKLYFGNEDGQWRVVRAGRVFEELAVNRVEGLCLASPAIADRKLFIRAGETLYAIDGAATSMAD